MVDMHLHTLYSDGDKTVEELLKMCEERQLKYISITDHDTCEQYNDIALNPNKIFTGKIIIGTELRCLFKGYSIEILGYNVDPIIINEWTKKHIGKKQREKRQVYTKEKLLKICDKEGLKYNINNILKSDKTFKYSERKIYEEIILYEENCKKIGELAKSFELFFRKGIRNPKSNFFIDPSEFTPSYSEVIDIIHNAGGKAFLAHPYAYQISDIISFIDELRKERELDGIECFHPTSEEDDKINILVNYARKNNLYITGGSDYHGTLKPHIKLAIGKGSLNINKDYIEEWVND